MDQEIQDRLINVLYYMGCEEIAHWSDEIETPVFKEARRVGIWLAELRDAEWANRNAK